MELPEANSLKTPGKLELMRHQARFVEEVKAGHRTFLLADEPGLGKTAQALLAASVSNSYPLLVVVPNVVKTNWAREVALWTPQRTATVVHGDGNDVDAFSDVVIVNYEVLDRHVGWLVRLQGHGRRRGALHQEPHQPALQARAVAGEEHPRDQPQGAVHGAHRHAADQPDR
jgi:hypothetical protein